MNPELHVVVGPVPSRIPARGATARGQLLEMLYQWEEPFVVDDRRFRERFRLAPTTVDQVANTLDWANRHYGRRRNGESA
jgi:hypothetical protein